MAGSLPSGSTLDVEYNLTAADGALGKCRYGNMILVLLRNNNPRDCFRANELLLMGKLIITIFYNEFCLM